MISKEKLPGLAQWFAFEDYKTLDHAISLIRELKIKELRTIFSWADFERPGGEAWFEYFVPRLSETGARLLPDFFYTPQERARQFENKKLGSYPPENLQDYSDFVELMILKYGKHFDWVQIWNEPNWKVYWDQDLDPSGKIFAEMAKIAAEKAKELGKKTALGGMTPSQPQWLSRLHDYGALKYFDSISIHQSVDSWPIRQPWFGWETEISTLRKILKGIGLKNIEIWLAETGLSTIPKDNEDVKVREQKQIDFFNTLGQIPADRIYWYCLLDNAPNTTTDDAINLEEEPDKTANYFGIVRTDMSAKPLFEHWKSLA